MAKCRELLNKGLLQDIFREQMWVLSEVREKVCDFQKLPLDKSHFITEVLVMEAMKDYVAHLDNKKRITLRGAAYQYYNVKEYGNGCIILEPRELAVPESISARTLADMDRAVSNFKKGDVSPVIDLSDF